jgi:multidrug resistance efflux pump
MSQAEQDLEAANHEVARTERDLERAQKNLQLYQAVGCSYNWPPAAVAKAREALADDSDGS